MYDNNPFIIKKMANAINNPGKWHDDNGIDEKLWAIVSSIQSPQNNHSITANRAEAREDHQQKINPDVLSFAKQEAAFFKLLYPHLPQDHATIKRYTNL